MKKNIHEKIENLQEQIKAIQRKQEVLGVQEERLKVKLNYLSQLEKLQGDKNE